MQKPYLECGKIVTTHGVRGEVKVMPWCDSAEYLLDFSALYLDNGQKKLSVERARVHKGMLIIKLAGVDSPEEAVTLRGRLLYIDRKDATADEDGVFFVQDLLGIAVVDADSGRCWGTLTDVFPTGANDVYEITGSDGVKRLIPAISDVVLDTDLEVGVMRIRPLKGLFEDAD